MIHDNEIEVTGPIVLELWVSSSVPDTDFTAKLVDVFTNGVAVPCARVVRTIGVETPATVPGPVYKFDIDMRATSNSSRPCTTSSYFVSSSEFPTYELNPDTGKRITHDSSVTTVPAIQRVFHDESHPSRLVLPVIGAEPPIYY